MILNGKQLLEYLSNYPPHFEKMILIGTCQQKRSLNIQQKDASGGTGVPLIAKAGQNLRITADFGILYMVSIHFLSTLDIFLKLYFYAA